MTSDKAPFTFYREGYIHGYLGHLPEFPSHTHYMNGYQEGKEADTAGEACKYAEDIQRDIYPVKPSQCV